MPIYEFYCADCHALFSFFSRTVNTSKRPSCPRCSRSGLERRLSRFAISRGPAEAGEPKEGMSDLDEARMERAVEDLAREAEGLEEEDPRHMARLMRRLYESTGMPLDSGVEEAIRRLEAGEDPETIEETMGDLLTDADPATGAGGCGLRRLAARLLPPEVDETIYDL